MTLERFHQIFTTPNSCLSLISFLLHHLLFQNTEFTTTHLSSHTYAAAPGLRPFLLNLTDHSPEELLLSLYWNWQTQVVRQALNSGGCIPRALVWRPYAGLGNRAQQITSAVSFAALTNRVFVVDWTVRPFGVRAFFPPPFFTIAFSVFFLWETPLFASLW